MVSKCLSKLLLVRVIFDFKRQFKPRWLNSIEQSLQHPRSWRDPRPHLLHLVMSQLMERMGRLLGDSQRTPRSDVVMKGQARRPKWALRNWRVLVDKLFIIMAFVERQALVKEWLPSLVPSEQFMPQSKQEEDSLEAVYAKIILTAKPLAPLKSKEKPSVSASTCIHPKHQLKGGGNKTASYVTCKMCHSRWESPLQAAEIKEDLKKQKQGLLSQTKTNLALTLKKEEEKGKETKAQGAAIMQLLREERAQAASEKMEVLKEFERERVAMREKEVQMQAMMSTVVNQKEAMERMLEEKSQSSQELVKAPKKTEGPLGCEPLCHCQLIAHKLRRLPEEGSKEKERHFWVCKTGQCEFFQWDDIRPKTSPSEMSFAVVSSRKRSKRSSFDLETGWGLSKAEDRKKMWRQLREEDPLLIILCPPCTAFSALQFLNFPKMKMEHAAMLIKTGMEHLSLAMAIAKWQRQRGKYFLFEHPAQAVSWKEEVVKKVEEMEGVEVITTDMCMFGLNVHGMGLNKKPTKLMIDSEEMRKGLERRCDKKHFHVPTLCGLPKKAQKYPQEFCLEVLKSLKKQIRRDEEGEGSPEVFMQEEEDQEEGRDLEEALEKQMEEEMKENRGEKEQRYQALKKLGFKESRLDPCIYKMYEEGQLIGLLAIEVDDILACGKGVFHQKMKELREQFTFGKWVDLKEEKEGASFNGRRLKQDEEGTLYVDMKKFIEERLEEIPIAPERKKMKKEEVNEQERFQARAVCGSLNWLSKEGRPDAAGPSSLMSSRLTSMKVEDLYTLNEVIKQLKKSSDLSLKVQPLKEMKLAVITDASFGDDGFHSQGGQMIIAHEEGLKKGLKVKTNLLWWRSAKLQRVVNSTLAAETQSLSKGMGDLLWMKVLFKELLEEKFNMYDWPTTLAKEDVVALATSENGELQQCLAIVDAKSVFDYLRPDPGVWWKGMDNQISFDGRQILGRLAEIENSNRFMEPNLDENPLMVDLLWSDPKGKDGYGPSGRMSSGIYLFGPDVSKNFMEYNGLRMTLRSHEVKAQGYRYDHEGQYPLITVFSAPNYVDKAGNMASVAVLTNDGTKLAGPEFIQYSAQPHPDVPSGAYAAGGPLHPETVAAR
eukprot:g24785.t1